MSAPLKFKPYVPTPQRQRKKNRPAPASHGHRKDVTLPEARSEAQPLQSIACRLHGDKRYVRKIPTRISCCWHPKDQENVATLDWDCLDWSDTQSLSQPMQRCCPSNADGKEFDERSRTSSSPVSQLAAVGSESIQHVQKQGMHIHIHYSKPKTDRILFRSSP